MGIDPCTHKAKSDTLSSAGGHSRSAANLSHMAQWESARLEAEARLVRESKLRAVSNSSILQPPQMGSSSSSSSTAPLPPAPLTTKPGGAGAPVPPPCLDVLRAWQGVWPVKTAAHGERIDLESPTSTLSFAENRLPMVAAGVGLMDGNAQGGGNLEPECVEWKCMGKERIDSFAGFSVEAFGGEAPWLTEPFASSQGGCAWGQFGAAGFTGMLLGEKTADCCSDSYANGHETCVQEEEEEEEEEEEKEELEGDEENKSYWNSILNSVNSSSSSNSPPVFYN